MGEFLGSLPKGFIKIPNIKKIKEESERVNGADYDIGLCFSGSRYIVRYRGITVPEQRPQGGHGYPQNEGIIRSYF
ncbi:MAG: hypothetical protein Kow00111_12690 [Thermincola ferriacetica]